MGDAAKDEKGRFLTGNNGGGRPKGARNKLGEAFIADLYSDWSEHGAETIRRVRADKPADYVKVVAGLLPKEFKIEKPAIAEMSDDELTRLIDIVRTAVGPSESSGSGEGAADSGEQAGGLPPLH